MGQFKERLNQERRDRRRAHELSRQLDEEEAREQTKTWITHWYNMPDTLLLKFYHGILQGIVNEGIQKWGLSELGRKTQWDAGSIADVRDGRDTITIGKLKGLLDFVDKPYESVEKKIIGIGSKRGIVIRNPKLPFNLNTTAGARVIAASFKDGGINEAHHYFQYTNYDRAKRDKVTEAVRAAFGEISPSVMKDEEGRQKGISFNTAAIGEALIRAGVPVGEKVYQRFHVPEFILEGTREQKIEYLSQTIGDEGHYSEENYDITFSQAVNIEHFLSSNDRKILETLEWKKVIMPSGYEKEIALLTDRVIENLDEHVLAIVDQSRPPNMVEESSMVYDLFGKRSRTFPAHVYRTEAKGYRIYWTLRITGKDIYGRMVEELGLPEESRGGQEW